MTTYRAVTTFSRHGLGLYGRRMLRTFRQHWAPSIGLTVYTEGYRLDEDWTSPTRDLLAIGWLQAFKAAHAGRDIANGWRGGTYNFRFDAVKFAHKTAAVIDAAERGGADVLVWLDGDIVTHAPVDEAVLDRLISRDAAVAWLDRDRLYPECGCYLINLRHHDVPGIIRAWKALYLDDRLFALPEWHDSFVFQTVVEASGAPVDSLSRGARTTSHPLVNGPLGAFLDHLKGPRKEVGRSRPSDLTVPRAEAYWQ